MTTQDQNFAELQSVLQHQKKTAAAQTVVQQLQRTIAAQETKAQELRAKEEGVAALETQREDLLADIATGNDKTPELNALDAAMAQHTEDVSAQGSQAAIEQTLAGLTRKLERAQSELQALHAQRAPLLRRMLHAQAEALGSQYVVAAQQLKALHVRLTAMGRWLNDLGQVPTLFMNANSSLEVHAFNLESIKPHVDFISPGMLIRRENDARHFMVEMQREKAALQALGVDIE